MKTRSLIILAIAAAMALPTGTFAEEKPAPPLSAAVLNFADGATGLQGVGTDISALLQVQLSTHSSAILVERTELNQILAEQELTLSDAVNSAQAAKVAQLTGAEVLVSGRVFAVQDRVHIVAKVISASTSRTFGVTAAYDKGKALDEAVEKLGLQVAKILQEKSGDLRGGASVEEQTMAKVKALLKDQPPRRVYIHIPETVVQAAVPDPAAQTELARTLTAAGWQLVESADKADLIIKGEAFSETASRRGNLWFARARLEFTITSPDGKTLTTDRVVCGSVDLTQAISAKGALQKAGLLAAPLAAQAWIDSAQKAQ